MRQQWFTHVRLLVAYLTRSCRAFPGTLTTTALNRRSFRWFGIAACTANPEGQNLHHWHSTGFVLATFYVTITPPFMDTRRPLLRLGREESDSSKASNDYNHGHV